MCLGIPGQIVERSGPVARVDFGDVEKEIRLDIVGDTVEEGDFVLNHAGFAIRKIPEEEAGATIETYEALLTETERLEEAGALPSTETDERNADAGDGGKES